MPVAHGISFAHQNGERMSILVVEDNPLSAAVLERHLCTQGWAVLHAADGRTALEVLERAPDVELLITDIQMPELDGLQLIEAIRARAEWKTLPILVATARASAELVTRVAMLGVRHMAVKPFNLEQLVRQVREALRDELPTLRSRKHVQLTLGVDDGAYRALLRGFGELVAARVAELEAGGADDAGASAGVRARLAELRESAVLAGADRVVAAIDAVVGGGDVEGVSLGPLIRELRRVEAALGRTRARGPAAAPADAAAPTPDDAGG